MIEEKVMSGSPPRRVLYIDITNMSNQEALDHIQEAQKEIKDKHNNG